MKYLLLALVLTACSPGLNQTLNPDPVHGGDCHDGNQLSTKCGDTCCTPNEYCGPMTQTCIARDPSPHDNDLSSLKDAGK